MPKGHPQPKVTLVCANALCGMSFPFHGAQAHLHRAKQHYCSRKCQNTTHGLAGTKRHQMWEGAKRRAKQNGIVFTLSLEDIPQVPETCPILGIKLCPNDKAGPLDSSPSLDRLNPTLGYIPGNVRINSNRANRLRSDATATELALLAADLGAVEAAWEPFLVGVNHMSDTPFDSSTLCPGIRRTVVWLVSEGFQTTDSGDGVGNGDMECAFDHPNVHMVVDPANLVAEAHRLQALLAAKGVVVGVLGYEPPQPPHIEVSYEPVSKLAIMSLYYVDDKCLFGEATA